MSIPVQLGEVLAGKYRVDRVLGAGGMGVVVEARHLDLEQRVALKFLLGGPLGDSLGDDEARRRFAREARAASRITGEHVARILDTGTLESGAPYIVMEYLEGVDLQTLLDERKRLPPADAVGYVLQALEALAEAHALGIVHRDIKPSNLFLTRRADGSPSVKVLDFGIAKMADSTTGRGGEAATTSTTTLLGSPRYMAPEQLLATRSADGRADLWSIGVVLAELVTGRSPFAGTTLPQVCTSILHADPTLAFDQVPHEARGLEAVVRRCLEKDVSRRFGSAGDLAAALRPFADPSFALLVERIQRIAPPRGSDPAAGTSGSRPSISPVASTLTTDDLAARHHAPVRDVGTGTLNAVGTTGGGFSPRRRGSLGLLASFGVAAALGIAAWKTSSAPMPEQPPVATGATLPESGPAPAPALSSTTSPDPTTAEALAAPAPSHDAPGSMVGGPALVGPELGGADLGGPALVGPELGGPLGSRTSRTPTPGRATRGSASPKGSAAPGASAASKPALGTAPHGAPGHAPPTPSSSAPALAGSTPNPSTASPSTVSPPTVSPSTVSPSRPPPSPFEGFGDRK